MKLLKFNLTAIALSLAGFGAFIILSRSIVLIPSGHVGIVDTFGQVSDQTLQPGLHFRNPFAKVVKFSTQTREFKETAEAPSKDGLILTLDMSILYRVDANKAKQLYQTVGEKYEQVILLPYFRSLIRNATANYEAGTLYTSQRQAVAQQLRRELSQVVGERGLIVEDTPLRNVILPESLQKSIQEKLQAQQETQRMEFVLEKERKEAERKRIEAKGIADSQRIIAQGLTDKLLQFRQIEATEKLAQSQNAKVVIVGADQRAGTVMIQP